MWRKPRSMKGQPDANPSSLQSLVVAGTVRAAPLTSDGNAAIVCSVAAVKHVIAVCTRKGRDVDDVRAEGGK